MEGLFERGRELEELDSQIERAAAGEGRLVIVEGPAGIGKSRLLAEARRRAEGSMRALSARGSELEGEFPFRVARHRVGDYPNFVEEPVDASAFFDADTWARLRQVKALYDPQDLFRGNHHVPPAPRPSLRSRG